MTDRYICSTCDQASDADALEHNQEIIADAIGPHVHHFAECPYCGSDDLQCVDMDWAVQTLDIMATHFQKWQGSFVTSRQAETFGNRLAEIKTLLEE